MNEDKAQDKSLVQFDPREQKTDKTEEDIRRITAELEKVVNEINLFFLIKGVKNNCNIPYI